MLTHLDAIDVVARLVVLYTCGVQSNDDMRAHPRPPIKCRLTANRGDLSIATAEVALTGPRSSLLILTHTRPF